MKIAHLTIENFLGARAVDIDLSAPVALIAGANGAGKSSVRDAVALALTADLGRVGLKKEAPQLITDGATGASVVLQTSAGEIAVSISDKGHIADNLRGVEMPPALSYVLDGQRFAQLDAKERRAFLFGLMGLSVGTDEVCKRLAARGCDEKRVEAIKPMLRAGFDAAAKEAAGKSREAKGSWREITGETYGEKKADGWRAPETPTVSDEQMRAAEAALEATEAGLQAANQRVGALQAAQRQHQEARQRAAGLREKAEKRQRILEKLERDRADLAEWEPKLASVKAAAQPRAGLVHDLARAVNDCLALAMPFGEMNEREREQLKAANDSLGAYIAEHGSIVTLTPHDAEMAPKLKQYEEAVALYRRAVTNDERDLADADAAAAALAHLEQADPAPDPAEIDSATKHRDDLKAERTVNASRLQQLRDAVNAARHAAEKVKRAAELHQAVLAWNLIAEALGPDGIPGDMLAETLDPLNARLAKSAQTAEWARIEIAPDMTIRSGLNDRPYALMSESEKWRCDAMIAEAIAHLSGLRLLVLDRMDVLDLPGRSDLLGWLDQMAEDGEIDTALLFGTLKALPASLPPTMSAHWIEQGVASQLKEAA
jgi:hypothetical protein